MAAQSQKMQKTPKRRRTYNVRRIKATWPYTVQEIAAPFNIHKNAVLRWIKEGLRADKITREYLIRGTELMRFLSDRQRKKTHPCAINEFFCFKCRAPRQTYLDIVDMVIQSPHRFRLKGLCAVCGIRMNKALGIGKLPKVHECFNIQKVEGQHIIECMDSIVNSDHEAHI